VPEFTGVSHAALTVTDVDRSIAWYTNVLGLHLVAPTQRPGIKGALLVHPASGLIVGLAQHDAGNGGAFDELSTGLDHLSFAVADRDALVAWERHLAERGVPYSEIQDVPYGSVLVLRDPDNIQLELFAQAVAIG
jgi:catechol 2,3-dioxygenase-like lactoylglutathione lyase family enzyme